MKTRLTLLLLIFATQASATTINAASCSSSDVQAAINTAVDGDTVQVPAGTCTWTATVTSSAKSISLLGAGIGQTNITSGSGVTNGVALSVITQSTGNSPAGFFRFSGFTMSTGVGCSSRGLVQFDGPSKNLRVDHNRFIVNNGGCNGFDVRQPYGVADSNTIDLNSQSLPILTLDMQGGTHGDESWQTADSFGTTNAMYYENNTITGHTGSIVGVDALRGARVVYRYNTFTDAVYSDHGTESGGRDRSIRHREVYENDFYFMNVDASSVASSRGGTGVVWNNRVHLRNGHVMTKFSLLSAFRRDFSGAVSLAHPWCGCGTFSVTSLTRSGTVATATTPGTKWISQNAATFPQCWITISNANDANYNGTFQVTGAPSETQVQYTVAGSPPTPDPSVTTTVRTPWDGNTDTLGYRCMDQPGAGQSSVIADSPLGSADPRPVGNISNALTPTYYWNNTVESGGSPSAVGGTSNVDVVVENRDFYNATQKPGYTPLTYPHPLVGGSPGAPTNFYYPGVFQ